MYVNRVEQFGQLINFDQDHQIAPGDGTYFVLGHYIVSCVCVCARRTMLLIAGLKFLFMGTEKRSSPREASASSP